MFSVSVKTDCTAEMTTQNDCFDCTQQYLLVDCTTDGSPLPVSLNAVARGPKVRSDK